MQPASQKILIDLFLSSELIDNKTNMKVMQVPMRRYSQIKNITVFFESFKSTVKNFVFNIKQLC